MHMKRNKKCSTLVMCIPAIYYFIMVQQPDSVSMYAQHNTAHGAQQN